MISTNRFNLVDEPWIPVAGRGLVSLATIFSDHSLSALGGNPVQKIALTKLLLAIAQSAYTPMDDDDWKTLGASGMARKALEYLTQKRPVWLYGKGRSCRCLRSRKLKNRVLGSQVYIATGNTTVLTQGQVEASLTDAERQSSLFR